VTLSLVHPYGFSLRSNELLEPLLNLLSTSLSLQPILRLPTMIALELLQHFIPKGKQISCSSPLLRLQNTIPAGWNLWYRPIIKHLQHKKTVPLRNSISYRSRFQQAS
jgi:hypothetical protein